MFLSLMTYFKAKMSLSVLIIDLDLCAVLDIEVENNKN